MHSIRLGQFRSYAAGRVETGGASVALYGPNGAGKTNVLEAVSLLTPGRGLRRAGGEDLMRRPDRLGWRVRAEVAAPGMAQTGLIEIVTGMEVGAGSRAVEIDGTATTQTALGHLVRMVWLTPAMDRLWMEGASERRRFLDRITLGFRPAHAEASVAYEKAMRERNRLLKEGRFDPAWLRGLEAQMARQGTRIARGRAEALSRLQHAAQSPDSGGNSLFPRADLAILGTMETRFWDVIRSAGPAETDLDSLMDQTESEEAAGMAEALAEGRMRDAAAGRTLSGPHRSDLDAVYAAKDMPARACSTGEQKALLISLILANARALSVEGTPPVLLLDEVAAHLDADRRAALYAEIDALGCQAWMTGTGPELFEALPASALRISVSETAGASSFGPA
ncbi:MAG: DNA replication/repair protein RecF [Pseudomonadota bacterium]